MLRAVLLFAAVYAATTGAILGLVPLPEIPLLRYVALAIPVVTSAILVASWVEMGAPWPTVSKAARSSQQGEGQIAAQPQRIQSRAG